MGGRAARPRAARCVALAGLTKFAPLALAPLFATHPGGPRPRARCALRSRSASRPRPRWRSCRCSRTTTCAASGTRTIAFQAERGSPFSIWGLYEGAWLDVVQRARAGRRGAAGAVALAFVPRRRDLVGLAALSAAILIALQLGVTHWFYLYIPWFFPLVMLALLGRFGPPRRVARARPARRRRATRAQLALAGVALRACCGRSRRRSARSPT